MVRTVQSLGLALLITLAGNVYATEDGKPRDLEPARLVNEYARPESRFATIGGVSLHYQDQGRGPALVLLHGSLQDMYDWDG